MRQRKLGEVVKWVVLSGGFVACNQILGVPSEHHLVTKDAGSVACTPPSDCPDSSRPMPGGGRDGSSSGGAVGTGGAQVMEGSGASSAGGSGGAATGGAVGDGGASGAPGTGGVVNTGGADGGSGDGSAVGGLGNPCPKNGASACDGHAQQQQLVCVNHMWGGNGKCTTPANYNCDSTPGATAGTCQPIVAECIGKHPGDVVCKGMNRVTCGPDLVTTTLVATCTTGTQMCNAGACVSCGAGTANCDANATDCETNLNAPATCGTTCANNVACSAANGTASCSGGACGISCKAGYGDCTTGNNGCETNLNAVATCGTTCANKVACSPQNVTAATCNAASCGYTTCSLGYEDCDGVAANGCETKKNYTLPRPAVDGAIEVPAGATLSFGIHGAGTMDYTCADIGSGSYSWTSSSTEGTLSNGCSNVGTIFGLTWQWTADGSTAQGTKVSSTTIAGSVPWVLYKNTSTAGSGTLGPITYIQRLDTSGGLTPSATCDAAHVGTLVKVIFSADYYFFVGP